MNKQVHQVHEFEPIYNEDSLILILGSFPSVKSRENHFYYGHPQNRFWKVLAQILACEVPQSVDEKKKMLRAHHIAVRDVIASCDITGSSDSSIRNVIANDLSSLVRGADIQCIFANGATAQKLYDKYAKDKTGMDIVGLPSTSPANAAYSVEKLVANWKIIKPYLSKL